MNTIFKAHKVRKLGGLAAGVVLCLGIANMPSALAADTEAMTVNPSTNWVQTGDAALSVSGQGCLPAEASTTASPTASTTDSPTASTDASTTDSPATSTDASSAASTDDSAAATSATSTADSTDASPAVAVIVSVASDMTDTDSWIDLVDPAADGSWSSTLVEANGDYYIPLLSATTAGGIATVYAWCVDMATEDILVTYTSVDVAVTGLGDFPPNSTTGMDITLEADGFAPGETVTFVLSGGAANINLTVGTGKADANGHVSTTINVPNTVEIDTYDLTLTGDQSSRTFVTTVTVGNPEEETTDNTKDNTNKMPDLGAGVA